MKLPLPKSPFSGKDADWIENEFWREASVRQQENRREEGAEPFVSCTVLAGNPISVSGNVHYAGETVSIRYSAAQRLAAQGRVSIP
jgi:hypothetical protein